MASKVHLPPIWQRVIRIVLPTAVFLFLLTAFVQNSSHMDWEALLSRPWTFIGAIGLEYIHLATGFFIWRLWLFRKKNEMAFKDSYDLYSASFMSRYLPGGVIWQILVMSHLSQKKNLRSSSTGALILSLLVNLLAGAILASVGAIWVLPLINISFSLGVGLFLLGLVILLFNKRILKNAKQRLVSKFDPGFHFGEIRLREWALSVGVLGISSWLLDGLALFFLLAGVYPSLGFDQFWFLLSCYYFAFVVGLASTIIPTGLGIREGILVFLLQTRFPIAEVIFATVSLRMCIILADILFGLPFLSRWVWTRKGPTKKTLLARLPEDPNIGGREPIGQLD